MKKILRIMIFSLLTFFFFTSCNKSNPVPPPEPIIPPLLADVSLLTYDTMTVKYELPEIPEYDSNLLEIASSDISLFTIKNDSFTDKIVIESNLKNKIGIANINFIYDEVLLDYSISVAVNYPQTYDEAVDAFSLACIKLPANTRFNITFNFYNLVNYEDFDASLEIYGWRGIVKYYNFEIGTSKFNTFEVNTNASYGTKESDMKPYDGNYQHIVPSFNYLSRSIHNESPIEQTFYIDQVEKALSIKNSEELFWSVEHGYRPILPSGDTKLYEIYESARDICKTINPIWSNLDKFRELYDYLINNTHYDYDPNLTSYGNNSMSYYLEGVFLDNGIAVCDGFSKAYALLCGILGLPCFRSYGFPEGENAGHAWNYVKLDNSWYLVCPTWGKIGFSIKSTDEEERKIASFYGDSFSVTNYDTFLASGNYFKSYGYSDLAWPNITRSPVPYSGNIDEINYHLTNENDAREVHNRIVDNINLIRLKGCVYLEFDNNIAKEKWNNLMDIVLVGVPGLTDTNFLCLTGSGENCICTFVCLKQLY